MLKRYLQARSFSMDAMFDGEQAWEAFEANEYALVLTDVMMPRLSGLDLIGRIRAHPTRGQTPVIIISAVAPDERQVALLQVNGVLRKPIPLRELLNRMEGVLNLAEVRRTGRFAAIKETAVTLAGPSAAPPSAPAAFGKPMSRPGAPPPMPPPEFGRPYSSPGAPPSMPPPEFGRPQSSPGAPPSVPAPAFGYPYSSPGAPPPMPPPQFARPSSSPGATPPAAFGHPPSSPGVPPPMPPPEFGPPAAFGPPATFAMPDAAPTVPAKAPAAATPFGRPVSTSGSRKGVEVPWAIQPVVAPPSLSGDVSLPALTSALVSLFEQRSDGVLDVKYGQDTWSIGFVDGFVVSGSTTAARESLAHQMVSAGLLGLNHMDGPRRITDADSFRMAEAAIRNDRVAASAVLEQLVLHTQQTVRKTLALAGGTYRLRAWGRNPVLSMAVLLDPLDLVTRTCLDSFAERQAVRVLAPVGALKVFSGEAFAERALLLHRHRPNSQTVSLLNGDPSVATVLARIKDLPDQASARELLALVMVRAVNLADTPPPPETARRATVLGMLERPWQPTGLASTASRQREAVARSYIFSGGRDAYGALGAHRNATDEELSEIAQKARLAFGPPAMDDADLGPAKVYLALLRRRRDEAIKLLCNPTRRAAYDAWANTVRTAPPPPPPTA